MTNNIPCEVIVWQILPAIRRELAKNLIENCGLTQKEAAEKLGLTEAAVSRYLSGKRGDLKIPNGKVSEEFKKSTQKINDGDKKTVVTETCRMCDILKSCNLIKEVDGNYSCR